MWLYIIVFTILIGIIAGVYKSKKSKNRLKDLETRLKNLINFSASKQILGFENTYLFAVDESGKKIAILQEDEDIIIKFSELIGVEIIEDGVITQKKSLSRTLGGALVGGVLAGGVGSVIGGLSGESTQKNKVSNISIKILIRDINKPSVVIECFNSRRMLNKTNVETQGKLLSNIYQTCRKNALAIKDIISVIIDVNENKN